MHLPGAGASSSAFSFPLSTMSDLFLCSWLWPNFTQRQFELLKSDLCNRVIFRGVRLSLGG